MTKRIGVVGLGSIGARHARNLVELGHEVKGCDPHVESGEFHVERRLEKIADWADGLVIASPTTLHRPHLAWAREVGKPTFIEKPIADVKITVPNNVIMVGYNLRFHQTVRRVDAIIRQGTIGVPFWANFIVSQKNSRPIYQRDGVILNWSHEIDLALHLLGPAKVAASSTRTVSHYDDLTDIVLLHDSGCRSCVHLDYIGDPEVRRFHILGSKGNITANLTFPRVVHTHKPGRTPEVNYANDSFDFNYREEMEAFIDRMDDKDTLGAYPEEAMEVLDICLQVRKEAGLP